MSAEFFAEQAPESTDVSVSDLLAYLNEESAAINATEAKQASVLERLPHLAESASFNYKLGESEGQKKAIRGITAWLAARHISIEDFPTDIDKH